MTWGPHVRYLFRYTDSYSPGQDETTSSPCAGAPPRPGGYPHALIVPGKSPSSTSGDGEASSWPHYMRSTHLTRIRRSRTAAGARDSNREAAAGESPAAASVSLTSSRSPPFKSPSTLQEVSCIADTSNVGSSAKRGTREAQQQKVALALWGPKSDAPDASFRFGQQVYL